MTDASHISVNQFAKRLGTHYFIIYERALRGVYGPVTKPPGKQRPLLLNITALQKRGLLLTELQRPRRMVDAVEIAQEIVILLGAEFSEPEIQDRIGRALRPLMEKLVPSYYAREGEQQTQESSGDTPPT